MHHKRSSFSRPRYRENKKITSSTIADAKIELAESANPSSRLEAYKSILKDASIHPKQTYSLADKIGDTAVIQILQEPQKIVFSDCSFNQDWQTTPTFQGQ